MAELDLTQLLSTWDYEPGHINARRIEGENGKPKVQVRIELGVLQMELEGRPDGVVIEGFPSLLEFHQDRLHQYIRQAGSEIGFTLSDEECRALREEAVHFYHRYVALYALGDYEAVVRDTKRNLEVFDLCRSFATTEEDRSALEQLRPSVIMMRARGEAEIAVQGKAAKLALAAIDNGLEEIRIIYDNAGAGESYESANEVQLLRGMRDTLVPKLPGSQRAELQERLQAALDAENFELAAILRDELRLMSD